MDEQIKVRFIGDASSIETASKQAVTSFDNVSKSSAKATIGVNKISQSIETLRAKMEARKSFLITETDISKIAVYNKEISSLKGQIDKIQKIGVGDLGSSTIVSGANSAFGALRKLSYILPGIGIAGLISQFSDLAVELVKGGLSVDAIASKLGLVAKKAVDVKAVMAGFGDIFKEAAKKSGEDVVKLEVYRQKLTDVNIPATERLRILKQYNAIADDTNKIDATQIGNLDLINQKIDAQNTLILKRALSTATMGKISEQANKLIENELKLQEELSKRGFKDLDDYIKKQAEANAARAKAFTADPNAFKKQGDLDGVRKGLDGVVNPALKAAGAFKNDESAFNSLVGSVQSGRGELQKLIGNLSGLITVDGITTEKVQDKKSKAEKSAFLFDFLPFNPNGTLKPEEKNTLLQAIDKFQKEFGNIIQGAIFTGTEDQRITAAKTLDLEIKAGHVKFNINSFKEAFSKLNKDSDIIPQDALQGLSTEVVDQFIRGFQNESDRVKGLNLFGDLTRTFEDQVDLFKTQVLQAGQEIPKTFEGIDTHGIKKQFSFSDLFDRSKISSKDAVEALQKAFEEIKDKTFDLGKELNKAINDAVSSIQVEGFASIGDSIAAALTGSNIGDVFKSFEQTLGSAVQSLGKQIIALNVAALAAKKALKLTFTNPEIGIAAGIALIAVGAGLKALTSGGIKGFAKGGPVPGSGTGDTVPAMLTPGEYVLTTKEAPVWQAFKSMIGQAVRMPRITNGMMGFASGGLVPASAIDRSSGAVGGAIVDVNISGESRTRGKDLVYVWTQTQKSQRRAT
jgi:hypothetical protein